MVCWKLEEGFRGAGSEKKGLPLGESEWFYRGGQSALEAGGVSPPSPQSGFAKRTGARERSELVRAFL